MSSSSAIPSLHGTEADPGGRLPALLKEYFGFETFRPFQREIMGDALAGRDVFALLPTGGGKSLCFQLPALVLPGLTVVISPLIALMKDQVDALQSAGVPATFLNSSIESSEGGRRMRGLFAGEYKLLYVAPERLMLPGFVETLLRWKVSLIAVDEAHCISEWGHDFRPEYRQLSSLRASLPGVPLMALTATATERVRSDILRQLQLKDPGVYVASFNRPNLTYRVLPKSDAYPQLRDFIKSRSRDSGIVYCASRRSAESLAQNLRSDGISAVAYHGGMDNETRGRNQEQFIRDEVRIVCATIAFGMGINKPNVRFVVHYDLPKNIEGYYQETGRAGRDGLPAECLLLFSPGDVVKQTRFIDEKPDEREKVLAREQLHQMVHYAESAECRRTVLLGYFGESFPRTGCGGCDNCLAPRETYDGTVDAQKLLSCVYRIRQHSGFHVGMNHVVAVLTGGDTDKIRSLGHVHLSTYGIGKEHSRNEWGAIGRELVRLGYLNQNAERFNVLELTDEGLQILKSRARVTLTRPRVASRPRAERAGEIVCDEFLFERLRTLRKRLADEHGVPPYIIFSDVSLRWMSREYPVTLREFRAISGVGDQKLRDYGDIFVDEIEAHLRDHPRQVFSS